MFRNLFKRKSKEEKEAEELKNFEKHVKSKVKHNTTRMSEAFIIPADYSGEKCKVLWKDPKQEKEYKLETKSAFYDKNKKRLFIKTEENLIVIVKNIDRETSDYITERLERFITFNLSNYDVEIVSNIDREEE